MRTYQDLIAAGEGEQERGSFCKTAVVEFMNTPEYRRARDGYDYYNKHNRTIEDYRKFLYTVSGRKVDDLFSANYKIKTLFFRRLVTQQVQYVLGNGLVLSDPKNKEKLGKDFDYKLQLVAKKAMAGGRAFGFWNYDHMEMFSFADTPEEPGFCPLLDEKTAGMMAGIRYWFRVIGEKKVFRCTLYEIDGYTEYIQYNNGGVELFAPKRSYILNTVASKALGIEKVDEMNYSALPIVCLYANDTHESELVGVRESIDCYDFVKSGLANDIDDTSGFYWVLKNSGGMNDTDLAKFVQRMKTVRAAAVDGDDQTAEAHTLDVPTEARKTMLEILRKDIYEDFQSLDVNTLSAAAKTTQEIQAAYQAQDNKCADFEYYVLDFVQKILALAEIDDNPTFIWNRVLNQQEQTNMILSAANYISQECIIKHLPFLTPEEADEEVAKMQEQQMSQFNMNPNDNNDDDQEDENEEEEVQEEDNGEDNGADSD